LLFTWFNNADFASSSPTVSSSALMLVFGWERVYLTHILCLLQWDYLLYSKHMSKHTEQYNNIVRMGYVYYPALVNGTMAYNCAQWASMVPTGILVKKWYLNLWVLNYMEYIYYLKSAQCAPWTYIVHGCVLTW
jgi:hypothetical protein